MYPPNLCNSAEIAVSKQAPAAMSPNTRGKSKGSGLFHRMLHKQKNAQYLEAGRGNIPPPLSPKGDHIGNAKKSRRVSAPRIGSPSVPDLRGHLSTMDKKELRRSSPRERRPSPRDGRSASPDSKKSATTSTRDDLSFKVVGFTFYSGSLSYTNVRAL